MTRTSKNDGFGPPPSGGVGALRQRCTVTALVAPGPRVPRPGARDPASEKPKVLRLRVLGRRDVCKKR